MDLLSKVYLNPELTEVWTLAPVFNDRGEQDLSIVCPTKFAKGFENLIRESGLPVKLDSYTLDEDHTLYKLMTCYFSPKNATGAQGSEEFINPATSPEGIKAKTIAKYQFELNAYKTDILGYESLIKEKFSQPNDSKRGSLQEFIQKPEIKEIMLQLSASKKKQAS